MDKSLTGGDQGARPISDETFRELFDHSLTGIEIVEEGGCVAYVNEAFCSALGYSPAEILGSQARDHTHPEDLRLAESEKKKLLSGKLKSFEFEKRFLHKKGHAVWARMKISGIENPTGGNFVFLCQMADITEHKRIETELLESRGMLQGYLEATSDLRAVVEPDRTILAVNRHLADFWEKDHASIIDRNFYDLAPPRSITRRQSQMAEVMETRQPVYETFKRLSEEEEWAESWAYPVLNDKGEVRRTVFCYKDITDRIQAQEVYRQSEELVSTFLDAAQETATVVGLDGTITTVSPIFARRVGKSEK